MAIDTVAFFFLEVLEGGAIVAPTVGTFDAVGLCTCTCGCKAAVACVTAWLAGVRVVDVLVAIFTGWVVV